MSDTITITMSREKAEAISSGLSDILCWCCGFAAARPEDSSTHPMGIERARDMNIALKDALYRNTDTGNPF